MNSIYYQNFKIEDDSIKNFIEPSIDHFYKEISNHLENTNRRFEKFHLIEYGEMAMVNFYINGIVRNDEYNMYNILNEFGMQHKKDKSSIRADIIIESPVTHEVFYIEAKINSSFQDAPTTKSWKNKEVVKEDYDRILEQAKKYLLSDWNNYFDPNSKWYSGKDINSYYAVAIVFDSVRLDSTKDNSRWYNYIPEIENEFYSFKTFSNKKTEKDTNKSIVGLACYGIIEEVKTGS